MGYQNVHRGRAEVWRLARRQHGVVTRRQLLALGFQPQAIKHRIAAGRLHPVFRGVYAVGRPGLTREGMWMAAVLACGPGAALSHASAAALWGIRPERRRARIEVSVPASRNPRRPKITIHRRATLEAADVTTHHGIPVTSPSLTLIDLTPRLTRRQAEVAVSEADQLGLTNPDQLREQAARRRDGAKLRALLDRRTFRLTRSELERLFLPLAKEAGLAAPETRAEVNGSEVDFFWPDLGLVVETDGLRYHRTPAQQARDRVRDQAHAASGLTPLRFTHEQVRYEPAHVRDTLRGVAARLRRALTAPTPTAP